MTTNESDNVKLPLKEMLKGIPGIFGIRLDEEPKYTLIRKEGSVEIRRYAPTLIAQVSVAGDHEAAVDEGFNKLAKYIFGENTHEADLAMTAPVYQEQGVQLSMTAPVYHEQQSDAWIISFVISEKFTLQTAPKPVDDSIRLVELPERTIAVLEYSGTNGEEKMRSAEAELRAWLQSSGVRPTSEIRWAQYDPPFAIPFFRKNEAQVEIAE
ncbi:MAG: heme-binding protein [Phycisphaerae bacterium]|nr:heme-binding protein [Gemmatimonadaceae bacterium]